MNEEETRAWLALAICTGGRPDLWRALARACGGAPGVIGASDEELAAHGLAAEAAAALRRAWAERAPRILQRCERLGIGVMGLSSPGYPPALAQVCDAPLV